MAFWDKGNKFPYTNNHDANLDYMMTIFENIKNEWHDLYVDLVEWKGTTTLELNTWKTNALAQIEQYETDFRAEIAVWKANTEQDIGVWEQSVLADLGTWRANFETLFATTFSNLTQIKTDAEAARDAAALSADAALESAEQAESSAESVSSALTQIATNAADISDLKTYLTSDYLDDYGAALPAWTMGRAINWQTGEFVDLGSSATAVMGTDYTEIKDGSTKLTLTMRNTYPTAQYGMAFYDAEKTYIANSGKRENYNSTAHTYDIRTFDIPANAKYFATTYWTGTSGVSCPDFFAFTDLSTDERFKDVYSKIINTIPVTPYNLFNPNDPDIILDNKIDYQGNITPYNGFNVSGFIPCEEGKRYTFPVYPGHFGGNARYIACYDENKEYVRQSTGVLTDDINDLYISTGYNIKYFRVSVCSLDVNSNLITSPYHSWSNYMIVEGTSLPNKYIPYTVQRIADGNVYSAHENLNNPLYGKKVVFTGDSICEGDNPGGGWAKRIGEANTMLWENCGIGGSTIAITAANKTICTRPLTMENPDYIILEGGTNDADRIGNATGEVKPEKWGTWSEDNYGTDDAVTYYGFDITTFCGAVDYMCKRFVSEYPYAHIGFIGAQKMGTTDSARENRGYYIHTAMEICKKWGIPCLNLWDECHMNPKIPSHYTSGENYLYIDGQHPTNNGYNYLSPIIAEWMKTI